jgi:hypothetical protein
VTTPERRTIRVFPDWASDWPLWENGHPDYNTTPSHYGLSAELSERLRRWADEFFASLDITAETPVWRGPKTWRTWVDEGRRISEALAGEVASFADVSYDFDPEEAP